MSRSDVRPLAKLRFRPGIILSLIVLAITADAARAADALQFFKNYFVTGDYAVGGVALRGQGVTSAATQTITGGVASYATGVIHINGVPGYVANGVPQHADIVAAYLYWQTIASPTADVALLAKGTFRGLKVVGTQIAPAGTPACVGSGGGNGNQSGAQALLSFRADVLRYLPYKKDPATGKPLGQRLVNDADLTANLLTAHTVSLPDSGAGGVQSPSSGNQAFLTEGASLVVVYRIGGAGVAFKSVVIVDGGYTFSSTNPLMEQEIRGFYQASNTSPVGKMTHIVGDGDTSFKEHLTVNDSDPTGISTINPFQGALGFSWDNLNVAVSDKMAGHDASIRTRVTPSEPASTDCLMWSAIVFSTTVQDSDQDGLLDDWEEFGFTDISDSSFVNLPEMGANKTNHPDIFVEIDLMCTSVTSGVCDSGAGKHSHLPAQSALDKVGAAFAAKGKYIHFDVGNLRTGPYVIPSTAGTQGGDAIAETSCGVTQSPTCLFPDYAGTVSWKNGFRLIKSGGVSAGTPVPAHFNRNRKDIFRYALFAHALALPKWRTNDKSLTDIVVSGGVATATTQLPHGLSVSNTITVLGAPAASNLNRTYAVTGITATTFTFPTTAAAGPYLGWGLAVSNGVPRSNSGVSDVGGGDLMITLGLWDNSVGSEFMQASTLLHELGHGLDLGHAGDISDPATCKPNYQSSMSYLFQVRGLLNTAGVPQIDYSEAPLLTIHENNLTETPSGLGTAALKYLPRWYAPLSTSFLDTFLTTTVATKHCDGTPVLDGANVVRIDGTSLSASPLDWNADGIISVAIADQDINFNGAITPLASPGFSGFDDWSNMNLQQVGARRGPAGASLDVGPGQDNGNDLGIAGGDLGIAGGDLGIAGGDLGIAGGDLGIAGGDLGIAGGDLGIAGGDLGGELDFESAKALGNAPNALTAAVAGFNINVSWAAPNVGSGIQYQVWRAACPRGFTVSSPCALSPSIMPAPVGSLTTALSFLDTTTKNNTLYIYFVTAKDGIQKSGRSNVVAISR